MVELTPEDVAEFRELYRREMGREITEEQARTYALRLLQFLALLVKADRPSPPPATR